VRRPNFVFIVADDLGYADLGCYRGREAAFGPVSPVLDRLATHGRLVTLTTTSKCPYGLSSVTERPV
jgi:arylsulfatase A-like enzyme